MKAYILYDIHTKQFFVSRDVVFHEEVFPCHSVVAANTLTDHFPDLVLPNPSLELPISHDSQHHLENASSDSIPPDPPTSSSLQQLDPPRRSSRVTKPHSYLRDFPCHLALHDYQSPSSSQHKQSYPLSQILSYESLSSTYKHFLLNVSSNFEPQYYHQAVQFLQWCEAIKVELDAIELNNTWSVTTLP